MPDTNPRPAPASNRNTMSAHGRKLAPLSLLAFTFALLLTGGRPLAAQQSDPAADRALRSAVQSEFRANQDDHSAWIYRDHDVTSGKDSVYEVVETHQGDLRRLIELNGRPLTGAAEADETSRILDYLHDPAAQARHRKAGEHDDAQAAELLRMLPDAFIWTVAGETPDFITLDYRPNPKFSPPDMQSRVMSIMAGQMIIARDGNRIRTLRGRLTQDVLIGWGLLGRLYQGGTFDIERRPVGGGHWQITESRVHIGGHALIFKTIGQQDDEVKSDFKPSTDATLDAAAHTLNAER